MKNRIGKRRNNVHTYISIYSNLILCLLSAKNTKSNCSINNIVWWLGGAVVVVRFAPFFSLYKQTTHKTTGELKFCIIISLLLSVLRVSFPSIIIINILNEFISGGILRQQKQMAEYEFFY